MLYRLFYVGMYNKISLTIDEQIKQLRQRGLFISDSDFAQHFLSPISYYRLAGYWWPMQMEPKDKHIFKKGSKFEDVISLYNFDRELRLINWQNEQLWL